MLKHAGLVGGLIAMLLAPALCADDMQSLRDDAIILIGPAAFVPGMAAYCNLHVEPNERLVTAAGAWNQRHETALRKVVRILESSGGMSREAKEAFSRAATQLIRYTVEGQADKPAYCSNYAADLESGRFDLQNGNAAEAFHHVMDAVLD